VGDREEEEVVTRGDLWEIGRKRRREELRCRNRNGNGGIEGRERERERERGEEIEEPIWREREEL